MNFLSISIPLGLIAPKHLETTFNILTSTKKAPSSPITPSHKYSRRQQSCQSLCPNIPLKSRYLFFCPVGPSFIYYSFSIICLPTSHTFSSSKHYFIYSSWLICLIKFLFTTPMNLTPILSASILLLKHLSN